MGTKRNILFQWSITLFLVIFLGYNYFTKEYQVYRNAILVIQIIMWIVLSVQLLRKDDK